jgi:cell wall-associated NlpC family hydrolase
MRSALLLVPALLVVPFTLGAQTRTNVSVFTHTGAVFADAQLGASLGVEDGVLGARLGVGLDAARPATEPARWAADADATVRLGVLSPRLADTRFFAGVGARQTELGGVSASTSLGTSYAHRLAGPLALEGELRYRVPFAQHEPAGVELRVGLAVGVARTPRTARRERPAARIAEPALPSVTRPAATALAARTIAAGSGYLGVPYRWGGNTPEEGFDCSGFLVYIFRQQGVELPRVSRDQARAGEPLPAAIDALRPGDLMFFARDGTTIDHVAMYAGDGRILHSSASGRGVRYDDLYSQRGHYYRTHFVAARRVLTEEAAWRLDPLGVR